MAAPWGPPQAGESRDDVHARLVFAAADSAAAQISIATLVRTGARQKYTFPIS
jgi:hypothetical protein